MASTNERPDDALTVREAMNRIGLIMFPDQWTGKEYLDHWRLGLRPWPTTKLRGMEAVRELLKLVWDGTVIVEAETRPELYERVLPNEVHHFHGGKSMVGDEDEIYRPCRLRFPPVLTVAKTSEGGRNGYNYAPVVVRILRHLEEHGRGASTDQVTHTIIADIERDGGKPPSYSRLQPYVRELRAYYLSRGQSFSESIPETDPCD